jgi:hypothetical protein
LAALISLWALASSVARALAFRMLACSFRRSLWKSNQGHANARVAVRAMFLHAPTPCAHELNQWHMIVRTRHKDAASVPAACAEHPQERCGLTKKKTRKQQHMPHLTSLQCFVKAWDGAVTNGPHGLRSDGNVPAKEAEGSGSMATSGRLPALVRGGTGGSPSPPTMLEPATTDPRPIGPPSPLPVPAPTSVGVPAAATVVAVVSLPADAPPVAPPCPELAPSP